MTVSTLLLQASAHAIPLKHASVQTVVTSPPYWGLRAYSGEQRLVWGGELGHEHEWGALGRAHHPGQVPDGKWAKEEIVAVGQNAGSGQFCACGAWYGALGLEPTPELYVEHMVQVFREVRRVLRSDGTAWVNLGDSYAGGGQGGGGSFEGERPGWRRDRKGVPLHARGGLKPKDLVGIPWRVAFALQADGWYLRSDIIWHKPNPMPESVTDRPTKAHEYLFLLTKSPTYFYDADAVREATTTVEDDREAKRVFDRVRLADPRDKRVDTDAPPYVARSHRNKRTVWTIPTRPYPGAHFATFPEDLVEPCILAGSSPKACGVCGAPWERVTETEHVDGGVKWKPNAGNRAALGDVSESSVFRTGLRPVTTTTGWRSTCAHEDDSGHSLVLDPFNGSGTTGRVAVRHGRSYVGLDISREYLVEQSKHRINNIQLEAAL